MKKDSIPTKNINFSIPLMLVFEVFPRFPILPVIVLLVFFGNTGRGQSTFPTFPQFSRPDKVAMTQPPTGGNTPTAGAPPAGSAPVGVPSAGVPSAGVVPTSPNGVGTPSGGTTPVGAPASIGGIPAAGGSITNQVPASKPSPTSPTNNSGLPNSNSTGGRPGSVSPSKVSGTTAKNGKQSSPTPGGTPAGSKNSISKTKIVPVPENNDFSILLTLPNTQTSRITGKPMNLNDFIGRYTMSPIDRHQRISDWWTLTEKFALYNAAIIHAQYIESCISNRYQNNIPANIQTYLASIRQGAEQCIRCSEIDFIEAQFAFCNRYNEFRNPLLESMKTTTDTTRKQVLADKLPIPVEVPTVQVYNTKTLEMEKNHRISFMAKNLNYILPLQYETVQARINESKQSIANLNILFGNRTNTSDDLVFSALERSYRVQKDMIQSIIQYNKMISAYAAETVAQNIRGIKFMASINQRYQEVSITTGSTIVPGSIAPVSYEPKTSSNNISGQINNRFNNSNRQPLSPDNNIEAPSINHNTQPSFNQVKRPIIRGQMPLLNSGTPNSIPNPITNTAPGSVKPNDRINPMEKSNMPALQNPPAKQVPSTSPLTQPGGKPSSMNTGIPVSPAGNNPPPGSITPANTQSSRGMISSVKPLSLEEQTMIRNIMKVLYPVEAKSSGAGNSPIVEIPLTLRNAIRQTTDSNKRRETVEAYWELRTVMAELSIEKSIMLTADLVAKNFEGQLNQAGNQVHPAMVVLTTEWKSFVLGCRARIAQLQIKVREKQILLLEILGRSSENGWPIPCTIPFWGPSYRLETENANHNSFPLLAELVLIPEKLELVHSFALAMGQPESLFRPELSEFKGTEDAWNYMRMLENKRLSTLAFVRMVESLNVSIVRYLSYYSNYSIPNDAFVTSLIGKENNK